MKLKSARNLLPALLLSLLLSSSCSKVADKSTATAFIGNTLLELSPGVSISVSNPNEFLFNFIYYDNNLIRFEVPIQKIPRKVGTFDIMSSEYQDILPNAILFTSDDDIGLDTYRVLKGAKNTFTINAINQSKKEVSGAFDLTFVIDTTLSPKKDGFPDTILLHRGKFFAAY